MQATEAQLISEENQKKIKNWYFDYLINLIKTATADGKFEISTSFRPDGLNYYSYKEVIQNLVDLGYTIVLTTVPGKTETLINWYPTERIDLYYFSQYQKVFTNKPTFNSKKDKVKEAKEPEEKLKSKFQKFLGLFRK